MTQIYWHTDAASGTLRMRSARAVLSELVRRGTWPPLDSKEEIRVIADGGYLDIGHGEIQRGARR